MQRLELISKSNRILQRKNFLFSFSTAEVSNQPVVMDKYELKHRTKTILKHFLKKSSYQDLDESNKTYDFFPLTPYNFEVSGENVAGTKKDGVDGEVWFGETM